VNPPNAPQPDALIPAIRPHVALEMLSQARYLSGARDLVSAVSKRFGFDEQDCGRIALAVDEALCNVIRHGYDKRTDGRIWMYIWPLEETKGSGMADEPAGGIRVVIEDEARQVDPSTIKGRDLDEIRPGGLGVFIMQQVMDTVVFQPRANRSTGMRLVLVKTIHPADAPAATGAADHGHHR
jgi:anti-sigma regulatory factor (Ser/Thr protein kinase)